MDYSTPGLPVHHQLTEFTQTHIHSVSDAIQASHPLLSPFPPTFNLSQHQKTLFLKKKKRTNQIFCNSLIAQLVKNPSAMKWRRPRFNSCIRNICWRRNRLPTPVSWSSLVAQLVKNQSEMLVTWVWSLGWEDPLEKGKTNHSSKAWRIPWTVYPWGHKESNMTEWLSLLQFFRYFEAE